MMKNKLTIVLCFVLIFFPYGKNSSQTPNTDVVVELNRVSAKLKILWKQKIKDSAVYKKMADYQSELTTFYQTADFLKQTKSILDQIEMLELYACRIRRLHELINNKNLIIPSQCGFSYKYQKSVAAFTLSMDLVNIIMKDVQMGIADRMESLEESQKNLIQAEEEISQLTIEIITYNV